MSQVHHGTTAGLLGYPDDERLLLVNGDDFGMYDAINEAVIRAFADGIVQSTSLMIPCPGAAEAMRLRRQYVKGSRRSVLSTDPMRSAGRIILGDTSC